MGIHAINVTWTSAPMNVGISTMLINTAISVQIVVKNFSLESTFEIRKPLQTYFVVKIVSGALRP